MQIKSVEIIEASLPFKHERMLYCCSELEGCQDSKKSDLVLEDFRSVYEGLWGSEHINSQSFLA